MNIEGSFQHILTDLVAFIATAIAGVVILATGLDRADGVAALIVAAIMLRAAYGLLRDSGRVSPRSRPGGIDVDEIGARDRHAPARRRASTTSTSGRSRSGFPSLSAHVLVHPGDDCHAIRRELEQLLDERFGIEHTTLQVDHSTAAQLLAIAPGSVALRR